MALSQGEAGGAFESPGDPAFMPEAGKGFKCFAAFGIGGGVVSLFAVDMGQVGEGASDAPGIADFAKNFERSLIQNSRGEDVALGSRDVALLVGDRKSTRL